MNKFEKFLDSKGITAEQFKTKEAEEMAALYNEYNEKTSSDITALVEKAAKDNSEAIATEIKTLKEGLESGRIEQMKSLNETLKHMGLQIKKLTEQEKADGGVVKNSLLVGLTSKKEDLLKMKDGSSNERIKFKAVADMLISSNVSGGNVPVEQRIAGLNEIASRRIRLMDIVSRGTATSNVISWVYQAGKEGAAGGTAEGAVKNQIDFDLVVDSESVKKRTAFIKVSTEMIGDIDFMEAEIRNELMRELAKDIESQVYEGDDGTGNLNGIKTTATAFTPGSFATGQPNAVDNANTVDVLRVAMNQIKIADHDPATFILMHPSDVTALKTKKVGSADDRYIDELQLIAGTLVLDGVPIIETTLVTIDEYLVGNFDLSKVWDRGEIGIEIGRDSDDFTKNLVTVLAEWRGLVIVKQNDRTAFVTGDFTTDKAAIETA